jgi:hypothetical protein
VRNGRRISIKVVVGTGFEPVKAKPADLQSAPVGHLGILPQRRDDPVKGLEIKPKGIARCQWFNFGRPIFNGIALGTVGLRSDGAEAEQTVFDFLKGFRELIGP